jgi:hypothetical protein
MAKGSCQTDQISAEDEGGRAPRASDKARAAIAAAPISDSCSALAKSGADDATQNSMAVPYADLNLDRATDIARLCHRKLCREVIEMTDGAMTGLMLVADATYDRRLRPTDCGSLSPRQIFVGRATGSSRQPA